jgi:iron-sulfur cluster insertion protein|tara:strand:- start:1182 stop:1508 length:327 start_codon:yes stop_codon:yes gene_type:complete
MEEAKVDFTENASHCVAKLKESENDNLRIYISGGGCSGFSYGFKLDNKYIEGDVGTKKNGVQLVIDPMSYMYLQGIKIDYVEDLQGARFQVSNPNARTTCGCGSSFSI